jgi:broad specificity phosphatase PhoE
LCLWLVVAVLAASPPLPAAAEERLWEVLRAGGHVVLLRHAIAPGTGDPADFELGDCSTQRNLDETGRAQARATGELMREKGIGNIALYSSQWCRCLETARLLGYGEPEEMPALNSLHGRPENRDSQVRKLKRFLAALSADAPPHMLVSHNATIRALTGEFTGSGAIVLAESDGEGGVTVLGKIEARPRR